MLARVPLDPAGRRCLLRDVHPDEKIDIRDELGKGIEFAEQAIGVF